MKLANISTLKNELSRYLKYVQRGERVRILDRNRPIADIVPVDHSTETKGAEEALLGNMETAGIVRRGSGKIPKEFFSEKEVGKDSGVLATLLEERKNSR